MFLIDDLVYWIGKKIGDMAEDELFGDPEKLREQLVSLQAKLDMGEITEEEYRAREEELLKRMEEFQKRKEEGQD